MAQLDVKYLLLEHHAKYRKQDRCAAKAQRHHVQQRHPCRREDPIEQPQKPQQTAAAMTYTYPIAFFTFFLSYLPLDTDAQNTGISGDQSKPSSCMMGWRRGR